MAVTDSNGVTESLRGKKGKKIKQQIFSSLPRTVRRQLGKISKPGDDRSDASVIRTYIYGVMAAKKEYNIDWVLPRLRNRRMLWNVASCITLAAVGLFSKIFISECFMIVAPQ